MNDVGVAERNVAGYITVGYTLMLEFPHVSERPLNSPYWYLARRVRDPITAGLHSSVVRDSTLHLSVDQRQYTTSLSGPNHCRATQLSGSETVRYISQWTQPLPGYTAQWTRNSTLYLSVGQRQYTTCLSGSNRPAPADGALSASAPCRCRHRKVQRARAGSE